MKRSKNGGAEDSADERGSAGARVKRLHVISPKGTETRSPSKRFSSADPQYAQPVLRPDLRQNRKTTSPPSESDPQKLGIGSPLSSTPSTPSNISSVQQPSSLPSQNLSKADLNNATPSEPDELIAVDAQHQVLIADEIPSLSTPSPVKKHHSDSAPASPRMAPLYNLNNRTGRRDERLDLLGQLLGKVTATKLKYDIYAKYLTTVPFEDLDGEIKTMLLNSDEWKKEPVAGGMSTRRFKRRNSEVVGATPPSDKMVWISRFVPPAAPPVVSTSGAGRRNNEGLHHARHQSHHGTRLSSSLNGGGVSGGSSSGRETAYESSTVRKKGGGRKLPASSGRCGKCNTTDTPQWRYIHNGRFCNACYMRVKRWVDSNLGERKLPSRARVDVTPEEDHRLTLEAHYLVNEAFKALEGKC